MPEIGIIDKHADYVKAGYCEFIHNKTWCNDLNGHPGEHFAQRHNLNSSGKVEIQIGPSKRSYNV